MVWVAKLRFWLWSGKDLVSGDLAPLYFGHDLLEPVQIVGMGFSERPNGRGLWFAPYVGFQGHFEGLKAAAALVVAVAEEVIELAVVEGFESIYIVAH